MCICNWARLSETHLTMLMCEPHTIRTQAVSISDSMLTHKHMHECTFVTLKNVIAVLPINSSFKMQLVLPHNCMLGGDIKPSIPGGRILSESPWSLEHDQLQNISVAVICIYKCQQFTPIVQHLHTSVPRASMNLHKCSLQKALSEALQQSRTLRRELLGVAAKRYTTSASTEEQQLS